MTSLFKWYFASKYCQLFYFHNSVILGQILGTNTHKQKRQQLKVLRNIPVSKHLFFIQVSIETIVPNAAAHKDGRLRENDIILAVDGINVVDASHKRVISLIKNAGLNKQVTLRIRRKTDGNLFTFWCQCSAPYSRRIFVKCVLISSVSHQERKIYCIMRSCVSVVHHQLFFFLINQSNLKKTPAFIPSHVLMVYFCINIIKSLGLGNHK